MDRYVLALSVCRADNEETEECKCLDQLKQIYDHIFACSSQETARGISVLPACSLSGKPSVQRWYFAVQACHDEMQFCSSDWEEVGAVHQRANSEEKTQTTLELCVGSLSLQEGSVQKCDEETLTELLEEAAEGVHALSDKLPPPGKALVDVLLFGCAEECPTLKILLPLLGALRHMRCWHSAKITVITPHTIGWQKIASYLSAGLLESTALTSCINAREFWRGGLMVREKKHVSELRFNGFSLRTPVYKSNLMDEPRFTADHKLHSEVFQYYAPVLDLLHLVTLSDLPSFLMSSTHFELVVSGKSVKSKLLLEQLKSLRGKVGALFSLSCIVTAIAELSAGQISSQRWKESLARRPKSLLIPDVEVKGESAQYFLLVQGSDNIEDGVCTVKVLHSDSQINGVPAMATFLGLPGQKPLSSSGGTRSDIQSLPCLQGDGLLRREQKVAQVQALVIKEYFRQKKNSSSIPPNDLKAILSMVREQYLRTTDSILPRASSLTDSMATKHSALDIMSHTQSFWPEKSVLHNIENMQKRRQRRRVSLLCSGSSDSLLGPKDCPKGSTTLLDAKELLKHFTLDGKPTSELQPLALIRGHYVFQLSPDLSPGSVSKMSFTKATTSHYHGIDFCLDNQRSLDRDQVFARLQSRLIRYETQTTCSREPCVLTFATSPAPSPAVMSEPGSVPDGETLQNADVARLKRRSWDTDVGGYPCKRQAKSESSDSVCSQGSGGNGTHITQWQPPRSQSVSSSTPASSSAPKTSSGLLNQSSVDKHKTQEQKTDHRLMDNKNTKESRSQKHNRMLQEVVVKTLKQHGISAEHKCFEACSKRLFDISKFFLKDLKTSRGLHDEMKKAAGSNAKQVIDWVLEKTLKKGR